MSGGRAVAYPTGGDPAVESAAALTDGYADVWGRITAAGIPVVAILNNPSPAAGVEMWQCADAHPHDLSSCAFDYVDPGERATARPMLAAAALVPGATTVDLDEWICPGLELCPAVIGNVMVYGYQSHLTRTYVLSMRHIIANAVYDETGGLFGVDE